MRTSPAGISAPPEADAPALPDGMGHSSVLVLPLVGGRFLQKPFTLDALAETIRQALAPARPAGYGS